MAKSKNFSFDGGAATYIGTGILAALITVCTIGIAFPYALCLRQMWRCKHTYINGRRLVFIGRGRHLFGLWIKWFLLLIITLGIYSFWLAPSLQRWIAEHTDFEDGKPCSASA
ncbi:MAG: DUF898 family protein [Thermoleophilia bacterium]